VRIEHRRATHVGGTVEVTAEPSPIDGRRITFRVKAIDDSGELAASGEIDRVIVDRQTFLGR
jgi:predicted thioesterase